MERNLLGTQAFDDGLNGIIGYYDDTTKEYSAKNLLIAIKNYFDVDDLKFDVLNKKRTLVYDQIARQKLLLVLKDALHE